MVEMKGTRVAQARLRPASAYSWPCAEAVSGVPLSIRVPRIDTDVTFLPCGVVDYVVSMGVI